MITEQCFSESGSFILDRFKLSISSSILGDLLYALLRMFLIRQGVGGDLPTARSSSPIIRGQSLACANHQNGIILRDGLNCLQRLWNVFRL